MRVFRAWLILRKSRSPDGVKSPVAVPGSGDAIDDDGSMEEIVSPPKFRANMESDMGVNFSRRPARRCFRFRASPTSGMLDHSSTETFD